MATSEEQYLLSKRDLTETNRLNNQHAYINRLCGGSLVHHSIPTRNLNAVADVATGTGIWLIEASQSFGDLKRQDRDFHGFDISPAQFLTTAPPQVSFSLQDAKLPFPAEYRNRYDLVNVRCLIAAIYETELPVVVQNIISLLKPGGYLQWHDLQLSKMYQQPSVFGPSTVLLLEFMKDCGFSMDIPGIVAGAATAAGLCNVSTTLYDTPSRPDLNAETGPWYRGSMAALLPQALLRGKQVASQEEAAARAKELLADWDAAMAQGFAQNAVFGVVVGRKKQ